jgi:hypothetical protein
MATIRFDESDEEISVPDIEVLASFRMNRNTAEREGFPRVAAAVQLMIDDLDAAYIKARDARTFRARLDRTILGRI